MTKFAEVLEPETRKMNYGGWTETPLRCPECNIKDLYIDDPSDKVYCVHCQRYVKPVGSGKYIPPADRMYNKRSWLFNQYVTLRKSSVDIGNAMKCSPQTIINALRRHKINRRGRGK